MTFLQKPINTAYRVIPICFTSFIVLSDQILMGMKDAGRFRHRFIDKVHVKGREDAVTVYEVFEGDAEAMVGLS